MLKDKNYSTYDKTEFYGDYSLAISVHESNGIDNTKVLGERYCIVIIEQGSGLMMINDKAYAFMSPCILCINEVEHIVIDDQEVKCFVVYFHPSAINVIYDYDNIRNYSKENSLIFEQEAYWISTFIERNSQYHGYMAVGHNTIKRFITLANDIRTQLEDQAVMKWPCRSRSYLIEMLFAITNLIENDCQNNNYLLDIEIDRSSIMYPVLTYIYNHYNEQLSVVDITTRFGINRTTLAKKMKETVGDSLISYINRIRIEMAMLLLSDTELPVSEIMYRVGFIDSSHFSRVFKKYTGLNPSLYREKNFTYCYGR